MNGNLTLNHSMKTALQPLAMNGKPDFVLKQPSQLEDKLILFILVISMFWILKLARLDVVKTLNAQPSHGMVMRPT